MIEQTNIPLPEGGEVVINDGAIERRDAHSQPVWTRPAGDVGDLFISLNLEPGVVRAVSWRGVDYVIDLADGAVVSTTFVK